jgi:hypothetical protein
MSLSKLFSIGGAAQNAKAAILRYYPDAEAVFSARGWTLPSTIDRGYVTERAERLRIAFATVSL